MKKFYLIIAIAVASVCLYSCTSTSKGPEKVAKQAIEALQKADYDAYAATFNLSSSDQKMLAGMVEEKMKEQLDKKGGIKSYKITDTQIEEDSAKVTVNIVYKDGSAENQDMKFTKVNDEWKQTFDK